VLGRLLRLTASAEELAEAHVAVGEFGEVVEQAVAQALGVVELASFNQVDGVVGQLVEMVVVVEGGAQ
jgi:hypothetical protein